MCGATRRRDGRSIPNATRAARFGHQNQTGLYLSSRLAEEVMMPIAQHGIREADMIDNRGEGASSDCFVYAGDLSRDQLWFSRAAVDLITNVIGRREHNGRIQLVSFRG